MSKKSAYFLMYIAFFIYSLASVFSKLASQKEFLSTSYILCFGVIVIILGVYAILWQQVLKQVPLSFAMANKPVALVLSILWAFVLFDEVLAAKTIVGIAIILAGLAIIGVKHV